MSEIANNNKQGKDDEIDLLDLFRRMGRTLNRWGRALGRAFLISVVFMLRRWLPLGLSIAAGIIVSYILKSTSTSFYTSDMVVRNNLVQLDKLKIKDEAGTTSGMITKIVKLHEYCAENNIAALSQALFMKPELVKNISDINAYWIIDQNKNGIPDFVDYKFSHNAYDTINIRMPDRIDIRVMIHSPQDLNLVRDGIIKYIESDSLYRQRDRLRMMQNHELLTRINYDIKQLDSLQKVKYFEETRNMRPEKGGQIIFMQDQKTQLVYNDIYYLYGRKQQLESERDLYKGILTVLSDFSFPNIRENGGFYYAKKVIPAFFLITLLILIFIANYQEIKEIFRKY
jgi:hypothetical protein